MRARLLRNLFFQIFTSLLKADVFFILLEAEKQVGQDREKKTTAKVNDQIAALLTSAAVEAKSTGKQVSRTAASFSHGLFCNDLLVNARPVKKQGEVIGAIS
ncbi:hypothetical protein VT98_11473, partial [Candidatus Electrothrix communis]